MTAPHGTTDVGAKVVGGSLDYMSAEMLALAIEGRAKLSFAGDTFAVAVMLQMLLNGSVESAIFPEVGETEDT